MFIVIMNTIKAITYASLFSKWLLNVQLAGVVAVEVTGGPTIDFVPGRKV